jgi:hypothetical protein
LSTSVSSSSPSRIKDFLDTRADRQCSHLEEFAQGWQLRSSGGVGFISDHSFLHRERWKWCCSSSCLLSSISGSQFCWQFPKKACRSEEKKHWGPAHYYVACVHKLLLTTTNYYCASSSTSNGLHALCFYLCSRERCAIYVVITLTVIHNNSRQQSSLPFFLSRSLLPLFSSALGSFQLYRLWFNFWGSSCFCLSKNKVPCRCLLTAVFVSILDVPRREKSYRDRRRTIPFNSSFFTYVVDNIVALSKRRRL